MIDSLENAGWEYGSCWAGLVLAGLAPEVLPLLAEAMNDTRRSQHCRLGVILTLELLNKSSKPGADGPHVPEVVAALLQVVDGNDTLLRQEAILCLGKIGPAAAAAVPRLSRALDDPGTKEVALRALAAIGPAAKAAMPGGRQARKVPDKGVRQVAGGYLAAMGDQETVDQLRTQLKSPRTGKAAIDTIRTFMHERPEVAATLLGEALRVKNEKTRYEAVCALSELRWKAPDQALPPLHAALSDAAARVRQVAVGALMSGKAIPDEVVKDLLRMAIFDPAAVVRQQAIGGMKPGFQVPAGAALEPLRKALHDRDKRVRNVGLSILTDWLVVPVELLPDLLELADDPDADVRNQLGYFLGLYATPTAVPHAVDALRSALRRNPDRANLSIHHALNKFGYMPDVDDLPWLLQPFRSRTALEFNDTVPLLARLGSPAIRALVALLQKARSPGAAKAIIQVLGEIGPPAAEAELAIRARLDDPDIRFTALWALGRIGRVTEVIDVIRPLLRKKDSRVEAVKALQRLGPEVLTLLPNLLDLARGESVYRVGKELSTLLVELAGYAPEVLNRLRSALQQSNPDAVGFAARVLGEIGPRAAATVPDLINLLRHLEAEVTWAAAAALGNIGPAAHAAVPELVRCLRERTPGLYYNAIKALGQFGPAATAAIPELTSALDDQQFGICNAAITSLGQIGPAARDVVPLLKPFLTHENEFTRKCAAEAIARINAATTGTEPDTQV